MKNMKEADLTSACVHYAGKYVDEKFKNGSVVEKNLVVNCLAHGFYMGRRFAEKGKNSILAAILFWNTGDEDWVMKHSIKAGKYYLKKTGYLKLEWAEQALIRSTVSTGFRAGFYHANPDA